MLPTDILPNCIKGFSFPRLQDARALWLRVHRYVGLGIGLAFVFLGLTGSTLVFYRELDEILNPFLVIAEPVEPAPIESLIAGAHDAAGREIDLLRLPTHPRAAATAWIREVGQGIHGMDRWLQFAMHPASGEILGSRYVWGHVALERESLIPTLYYLHFTLLAGPTGKTAVGFVGVFLLLSCITGVVLWWPRNRRWRKAMAIKRGAGRIRLLFDLHRSVGAAAAILLAVAAFTGVYMVFPKQVSGFVGSVLPLRVVAPPAAVAGDASLNADAAVKLARAAYPDAHLTAIGLPIANQGLYRVILRQAGEARRFGTTSVWVDPVAARVVAMRDPLRGSAGDTFIEWQFPLHSGEAFGMPGRLLVFTAGLAPLGLFVTGFLIWRAKRRSNLVQVRRRSAATQSDPGHLRNHQ